MKRVINDKSKKEARRDLRKNQTKEEILLWSKIRNKQLGCKWKRQVSIGRYVADFYCREKFLAVELDGFQHLENKEYDKEREKFFELLGIKTLRFWNREIKTNIDGVIKVIIKELKIQPHPSPLLEGEGK
jgi:very-short-patch-repair endonuclease